MKNILFATIAIITLSVTACSKGDGQREPVAVSPNVKFRDANKFKMKFHDDMETMNPGPPVMLVVESLKKNHLDVSSTRTIGEAFDSYTHATKKEWRETFSPIGESGQYYIDFICWLPVSPFSAVALKEGVVQRKLEIKIVIRPDGETYIALARFFDFKSDGMLYVSFVDPAGIRKIVTAIYENREIVF